jgi:predicted DNA-binding ribbon-helix-helix protein
MPVRKHSVSISGHRTSFSIEEEFLALLKRAAEHDGRSLAALIAEIDEERPRDSNLSSALRVHALDLALQGRFTS